MILRGAFCFLLSLAATLACRADDPKQGETDPGVEGYDAVFGTRQDNSDSAVPLPDKWIPKTGPNPHSDAQWFHQAAFGLFLHWGIVSGMERGETWDQRIEWDPNKTEAENLKNKVAPAVVFERAKHWNPDKYNPDKWMKYAALGGFRYAVLTTRHHDAYALYPSKFGNWHTGVYMGGRDLIKPYVDACRSNDIKVGFYFSGPSWYHGYEFMNFKYPNENAAPFFNWKHEQVEALPPSPQSLAGAAQAIARGQIMELMQNYGKIDLFWPDGGSAGVTFDEVRRWQPGIIWSRDGEIGTPEGFGHVTMELVREANRRHIPWEFCTIGHSGGWHWSSQFTDQCGGWGASEYLSILAFVRARGGNLLLNIAPRADGEMPPWFYTTCEVMGQWMKWGAEAIYDIDADACYPYPDQCKTPVTHKGNTWYLFTSSKKAEAGSPLTATNVDSPTSVRLLRTGESLPYNYANRTLVVPMPAEKRIPDASKPDGGNLMPEVVKVVFGGSAAAN